MGKLFTSESVTEGHPDKICDQISDSVLDALLSEDEYSRCACEVTVEPGAVHIMGEITSNAKIDYEQVARSVIRRIGYTDESLGFSDKSSITCSLHEQSADIAMGVNNAIETRGGREEAEIGAGDQGMMFGYACNETPELMPMSIMLAHRLTDRLAEVRHKCILKYLRPDGKSQVTLEYSADNTPRRIDTIVLSTQHNEEVSLERLRNDLIETVIKECLPQSMLDSATKIYINPTGRFVLGGPAADTGLTGRKIIVDTYGGFAHHGGGAFSGKDPTKVDRSAAYMARNIAKTIVASGVAKQCEIQVCYAIGVAEPVSLWVDCNGTSNLQDADIKHWILDNFDLRPSAIMKQLGLRKPIYAATASNGHFGNKDFPWEQIREDKVEALRKLI